MAYRSVTAVAAASAAMALIASCSSTDSSSASVAPARAGSGSAISGTVTVFAAASLQEAFSTIAKRFEAVHRDVKIRFNFAASSTLAAQINQGAPADVFASASPKNMHQVPSASTPTNFAKNVMEIAVPPTNPAHVTGLSDLTKRGIKVALCQPQVPCGATAAKVFAHAHLSVKPVTLEADVKSTLSKVELNEVDAAVVYVTDVRSAGGKVVGISIPDTINAATEYPIATLKNAPNERAAKAFVSYVLSQAGATVLTADGFQKP